MGSSLGKALSMTSSTSWNDVVNKIKGVANKGAVTSSLNCGASYTIPAGYHNGSGKITANSLSSQTSATASAGNILTGKTAWVNGKKLTGSMKDYSSAKQTATTSTSDQTKSCYWARDGYIDIVPAIGYWGSWNWDKSYIRVPASSSLKHTYLTLKSSSSTYNFKYYTSSGSTAEEAWFYLEYNWSFNHQIVSAFIYINGVSGGYEYYMLSADGRCCQLADNHWVALNLTHPSWNTGGYFPFPVAKSNTTYTVSIWYI